MKLSCILCTIISLSHDVFWFKLYCLRFAFQVNLIQTMQSQEKYIPVVSCYHFTSSTSTITCMDNLILSLCKYFDQLQSAMLAMCLCWVFEVWSLYCFYMIGLEGGKEAQIKFSFWLLQWVKSIWRSQSYWEVSNTCCILIKAESFFFLN